MIDRRVALALGGVVMGCVLALAWWLVTERAPAVPTAAPAPDRSAVPQTTEPAVAPAPGLAAIDPTTPALAALQSDSSPRVRGVVMVPEGRGYRAVSGAQVTLYRQLSAWPEWRRVTLESATTGSSGSFQFGVDRAPGLLIGVEHRDHVADLLEVPLSQPQLEVRLQRGFDVEGVVTNDTGLPLPNVRVAIETIVATARGVRTVDTNSSGRFRFANVAPGTMRVVARHERWQPAVQSNVVVGVDRVLSLRFDSPALTLDGRVVAATTQEPVAGAEVLALPFGQQLGRNEPATAVTRTDGTFRITGLARGNLRVEVRHRDLAAVVRTIVVEPSSAPLVIDLPQRSQVRGRLAGSDVGVAGARLLLRSAADEIVVTTVADDGSFQFNGSVTPGWATLSAPEGRFAFARAASVLQVLIEEAGREQTLDLDVGPPAVVQGRVVDTAGAPVAGARLLASEAGIVAESLLQAGSALLERNLRNFGVARSASGGPTLLLAMTDRDGIYRIAGQAPGPISLRVECDNFGCRRLALDVPALGQTVQGPQVVLERACRIVGHVRRGDGPLAGAQVLVFAEGLTIAAVSGVDGGYELSGLPPGDFEVRARYSTLPTQTSRDPVHVEPTADATVDLVFAPGRLVRGVVHGRDGMPVEGAMVVVRGEQGNPVATDSNGRFSIEAPNRAAELQVVVGDSGVRAYVPIDGRQETVDVPVDAPPNCTISALVLGLPGRRPLADALLRWSRTDGDDAAVRSRWIELNSGRLRHPWFPPGRWRLQLWSEGYAPVVRDVDLAPGAELALGEVLLETGCEVSGQVVDVDGHAIAGAEVFPGVEADLDVFRTARLTGEDGRFHARGIASAAATLVARAPGYAWTLVPLQLPHDVLAGAPVIVRLERGSTIEVELTSSGAGSIVVLRRNGRILATAAAGDDGKAVFPNQGAGDYVVQRFGDERQQASAVVGRSGTVVRVRL